MNTSKFEFVFISNLQIFGLQMCLFNLYQMRSQPESIRGEAVRETRYQDADGLTFDPIFLQIQLSPPSLKSHSFDNPYGNIG
jgi:hypothetical protein